MFRKEGNPKVAAAALSNDVWSLPLTIFFLVVPRAEAGKNKLKLITLTQTSLVTTAVFQK